MREILFRGKHICGNGDWIYGYYFQKPDPCTKDGKPIAHCISDLPPFGSEIVISTLGQFTGLTDKNGKKIFEGDIMSLCQAAHPCLVYWDGRGWAWMQNGKRREIDLTREMMQVIGNIHDNPEMMEDK